MLKKERKNMDKQSGNLWTIAAVLLLIVLVVAGYKFKASMTPDVIAAAELDKSCDLRKGSCASVLPTGGKVTFSITPNTIPILRPLEISVETEGVKISKVAVDFVGIDMDMGYNRSKLKKIDANHFKGKAIIPVCVRSKMDWEAKVLLTTDHGLLMAPFRFYTIK